MRTVSIAALALMLVGNAWGADAKKEAAKAAEPAKEEFVSVTATGVVELRGSEEFAAKKAEQEALREAVMKVAGQFISATTQTREYTLMQDVVLASTTGYVRDYKVIKSEADNDNNVYRVTVQAQVGKTKLDVDAMAVKTLMAQRSQRRLYVSVVDTVAARVGDGTVAGGQAVAVTRHGAFDGKLRDALRADGFTLLDPNVVEGKIKAKSHIQSINTHQEALEIAGAIGADVIIYGHCNVSASEGEFSGSKIHNAQIRTSIVVTSIDSTEAIADFSELMDSRSLNATSLAINAAVDKAAEASVKKIRVALFEAWRKQLTSGQKVYLTVTGLKNFGAFGAFQNLLRTSVPTCKEVFSPKYDKGSATMELTVVGSTADFSSEVSGKNFQGQVINVMKVNNNVVELALGK